MSNDWVDSVFLTELLIFLRKCPCWNWLVRRGSLRIIYLVLRRWDVRGLMCLCSVQSQFCKLCCYLVFVRRIPISWLATYLPFFENIGNYRLLIITDSTDTVEMYHFNPFTLNILLTFFLMIIIIFSFLVFSNWIQFPELELSVAFNWDTSIERVIKLKIQRDRTTNYNPIYYRGEKCRLFLNPDYGHRSSGSLGGN